MQSNIEKPEQVSLIPTILSQIIINHQLGAFVGLFKDVKSTGKDKAAVILDTLSRYR